MKTKRKNRFFCLLIAIFQIACLAAYPSAATSHLEEPSVNSLDSHLVTHWSFEGETVADSLLDHAPDSSLGNQHRETLTELEAVETGIDVKNGIASITPDESTSLWLGALDSCFDGFSLETPTTYYVKANYTGAKDSSKFIHLLQIEGLFRLYINNDLHPTVQIYAKSIGADQRITMTDVTVEAGREFFIALSFGEWKEAESTRSVTLYYSANGLSYETVQADVPVTGLNLKAGRDYNTDRDFGLHIGNNRIKAKPGVTLHIDDICVYNKALSKAEVGQIYTVPRSPVVVGCQDTGVDANGMYAVRLIATIADLNYTEAGFSVEIRYQKDGTPVKKTVNKPCAAAYESLIANTDGKIKRVEATELGGQYLIALTVEEIPSEIGEIIFDVIAYGKDETGMQESQKTTFVYDDGIYRTDFNRLVKELSPVAAWSFDGESADTATVTELVSGRIGTLVNSELADGYYGKGLRTYSNQKSYLDLGAGELGSLIDGKKAVSFSMWVLPYLNSNESYRMFTLQTSDGATAIAAYYRNAFVRLEVQSKVNGTKRTATFYYNIDDGTLSTLSSYTNAGKWQHLVFTVDLEADAVSLFVNGELFKKQSSMRLGATAFEIGTPTAYGDAIGGAPTAQTYSFNGVTDSVMLFDRVITAEEVAQLYSEQNTENSPIKDQHFVEKIVEALGENVVFYENGTELIHNGRFEKLRAEEYSAKAILRDGVAMIPKDTASRYFANLSGLSEFQTDGIPYVSLPALCDQNGKELLIDGSVWMVMEQSSAFDPVANRGYLNRIAQLFEDHPSATIEGADSRVVVAKTGDVFSYAQLQATVHYCTCPSIAQVGDSIFVSMDTTGGKVFVFESTDGGKTFVFRSFLTSFHFASLFELNGDLYLMGSYTATGTVEHIGIAKSTDGARSWSAISHFAGDGLNAHTTSNTVLIANGRVYKAYNGRKGDGFEEGCTVYMVSAPVDANLLDPSVWTVSNSLAFTTEMFTSHPNGSQNASHTYAEEGNAVPGPNGEILMIYGVKAVPTYAYAAVFHCTADGKAVSFDAGSPSSILSFPGGNAKFNVRYDEVTGKYLAMVTRNDDNRYWFQRNVLALLASDDMVNWELMGDVLTDPTVMNEYAGATKHGFQYVDFLIDGKDLIFVVREAMDDSHCFHNANYLTFYRIQDYARYIA